MGCSKLVNWNQYEKMIINQIKEAKEVVAHAEKEHRQALSKLNTLETQYKYFKASLGERLGDK
jgi:hypothetical protein